MSSSSKVAQMLHEIVLEEKGINKRRLSLELGLSSSHVWKIFEGQRNLTAEVALRLEGYSGIPAYEWLMLQAEDDLSEELLKRGQPPIDLPLPKTIEQRVKSRETHIGIDDALSLKEGVIETSHEVTGPKVMAFDGNDSTSLNLKNHFEPCWVEKRFLEREGVELKKVSIQVGEGEGLDSCPKSMKLEGLGDSGYENINFKEVTGLGELQNNEIYIRIDRPGRLNGYIRNSKKYKSYKLTMTGSGETCTLHAFEGYEAKE